MRRVVVVTRLSCPRFNIIISGLCSGFGGMRHSFCLTCCVRSKYGGTSAIPFLTDGMGGLTSSFLGIGRCIRIFWLGRYLGWKDRIS